MRKGQFAEQCILWGICVGLLVWIGLGIFRILFWRECVYARATTTKVRLHELHSAVQMFKVDTGRYPSQENGLIELIQPPANTPGWAQGGYLETTTVPRDGWKNEFIYKRTPEGEKPFVIISCGADGRPGGTEQNAHLTSTDPLR